MQKYKFGRALGDGSFGSVRKAINQKTGEVVAIKHMKIKFATWQECENQKQVKILKKLHHPNIISLHELIKEKNELFYVFEFMERNVYELLREEPNQSEVAIRNVMYQSFQALAYMHRHGYFHRDLKPENLLQRNGTIKLADFGLIREIRAKPPFTEYVSTRWYRAPEVLLHSRNYNSPMDIFAMGAIMAELYTGVPLFPGSNERDQLHRIFATVGCPSKQEWPDGYKLASSMGIQLSESAGKSLQTVIPRASPEAISLIQSLLLINSQKRPTASQVLKHEYFQVKLPPNKPIIKVTDHQISEDHHSVFGSVRYRPGTICKQ